MNGPCRLDELLIRAATDARTIERAVRAADLEGIGVLLVRDDHGHLVGAFLCDDVPAAAIHEADGPLRSAEVLLPSVIDVHALARQRRRGLTPPARKEVA